MSNDPKPARAIAVTDRGDFILMGIEFDDGKKLDVLLYPGLAETLAKHVVTGEYAKAIIARGVRLQRERDTAVNKLRDLREKVLAIKTARDDLHLAAAIVAE